MSYILCTAGSANPRPRALSLNHVRHVDPCAVADGKLETHHAVYGQPARSRHSMCLVADRPTQVKPGERCLRMAESRTRNPILVQGQRPFPHRERHRPTSPVVDKVRDAVVVGTAARLPPGREQAPSVKSLENAPGGGTTSPTEA